MKAVTVCQPWAWSIVHSTKRVENRSWYTSYRGPLAIHAGKSRQWMTAEAMAFCQCPAGLVYGAIIGTCELVGCVRPEYFTGFIRNRPQSWGHNKWVEGPWCWVLDKVIALPEPIPMSGAQGLWTVPDGALCSVPKATLFD